MSDLLGVLASLRTSDLEGLRSSVPAAVRVFAGARLALLGHPDPLRPDRWWESSAGERVSVRRSSAPSALAAAALEPEGTPERWGKRFRRECRKRFGFEPALAHGWPLEDGGCLLVLDPERAGGVEAHGAAIASLVGGLLSLRLRAERARARALAITRSLGQDSELDGVHPEIVRLRAQLGTIADSPLPLLVIGEPGTGKRHLARALHAGTWLRSRPFLEVSPGEAGDRLEEQAVLYVRDALELALEVQAELARRLERPDDLAPYIILASNSDPEAAVARGDFHAELFRKLAGNRIELPALRHRPEDVPLLAERFLERAAALADRPFRGFTHPALERLRREKWPRNLDELDEAIRGAVGIARGDLLDVRELAPFLGGAVEEEEETEDAASAERAEILALLGSPKRRDWVEGVRRLDAGFFPEAFPAVAERTASPEPVVRMEAVRLLVRHGGPEILSRILTYLLNEESRDVLAAALDALEEPSSEPARRMVLVLSRHEAPEVRSACIRLLERLADDAAAASIRSLADDDDPRVRAQALAALGRLRGEGERELLEMARDERVEHRGAAMAALGSVATALDLLVRALAEDPSIEVRGAAAHALGARKEERAVGSLVAAAREPLLFLPALEALAEIGSAAAEEPLFEIVEREASSLARRAAIRALAATRDPRIVERLGGRLSEPGIAPAVLEAIAAVGGEAAERALLERVHADDPLCHEALKCLARIATVRSVPEIVDLLGGAPEFLARAAVDVLVHVGPPAVEDLVEALEDESRRFLAVEALGRIGDARAVVPLMRQYDYAEEVEEAIRRIGPEAIDPLLSILPDRQVEIRRLLVDLGELAIPSLVALLASSECAAVAEQALVDVGTASVGPLLDVAAEGREASVVARVLRALGRIGGRDVEAPLLRALGSTDPGQRIAAVEGLSVVRNPEIAPSLLVLAGDLEAAVAIRALGALAAAGPEFAASTVLGMLRRPEAAVRAAALLAASRLGLDALSAALGLAVGDSDPLVARTAGRLLAEAGGLSSWIGPGLFEEGPPADAVHRVRLLGLVPGSAAEELLVQVVLRAPVPEARSAAVEELARRDTRAIPALWLLLESPDPGLRDAGSWILDRLGFSRSGAGSLAREHARATPARKRAIERHLHHHRERARDVLAAELRGERREEDRGAILGLLCALEIAEGDAP